LRIKLEINRGYSRTMFMYVSGLKLDIQGEWYLENIFEFLSVGR